MWAVYLCGCTDCFLHALFADEHRAKKWAIENSRNPEGYVIHYYATPNDIPNDDTGWERPSVEHIYAKDM